MPQMLPICHEHDGRCGQPWKNQLCRGSVTDVPWALGHFPLLPQCTWLLRGQHCLFHPWAQLSQVSLPVRFHQALCPCTMHQLLCLPKTWPALEHWAVQGPFPSCIPLSLVWIAAVLSHRLVHLSLCSCSELGEMDRLATEDSSNALCC